MTSDLILTYLDGVSLCVDGQGVHVVQGLPQAVHGHLHIVKGPHPTNITSITIKYQDSDSTLSPDHPVAGPGHDDVLPVPLVVLGLGHAEYLHW